jgi:glycosyltransferase involved in cell wall biosynthesis
MVLKRQISVVIPTFDRLATLREALASIRDVEGSGVQAEFEIVVGDNGLKEETRRLCLEYDAIYAPAYGRGASYARNAAMGAASGEFIAFLDDDDVWLRGHIGPHLAYLDAHPNHDAVFGQVICTDPELNPISAPVPEDTGSGDDLTRRMLSGLFPQIGTVVARRSVIDSIGYFDTRLIGGQDLDWLLRLATKNKLGFVSTPCILFRSRAPETYDALNRMRVRFDRQVFLRHGMPNALRLWKSPLDMIRAYHQTLFHFYRYFTNRAIWCAENGSAGDVVRELKVPALYLPLLLASEIFQQSPLRTALLAAGRRWLKGGAGSPGRPPVGEAIDETAGPGPKAVWAPLAASEASQMQEAKARAMWSDALTNGSKMTPTGAVLDELHHYSGIPLAEVDELVNKAPSKTGPK